MILGLIQARTSSSRLPGKVLKPLLGKPMLARQFERVQRARRLDGLAVATSRDQSDDAIAELCRQLGIGCHRGSLDDVLDRFYGAAQAAAADHVVRLTGDCPLIDPSIIDAVIALHLEGGFDYTSNAHPPSFPDGLDVEVMRFACLERAWQEAKLPSEREHVTPYLYDRGLFRLGNLSHTSDLSELRWTVDEVEDLIFVEAIYGALQARTPEFGLAEVLAILHRRPELNDINRNFQRDEGYRRSVAADPRPGATEDRT